MKTRSQRARLALVGTGVAAAVLALTSCSGGGGQSDGAAGDVDTETFLTFETPAITPEFWDMAIDTTLESVPGLEIERILTPDADRNAYAKQLQASGQFPGLLASISPGDFVDAGLLAPYDKEWLEENFLYPEATEIDGAAYQPPAGAQILPMVYYNKTIFNDLGLEVPTTWDEFTDVVTALKDAGVTPIELAGLETWSAGMPIVALASVDVLGNNPDWIQERYEGEVKFTDPEFASAMQKQQELIELGAYSESALSVDYATANNNFFDGKSGMYIQGSWLIGGFPKDSVDNFGSFLFPSDDGTPVVPFSVGGTMSVSTEANDLEKAMDFAKTYTLEPTIMTTLIETDGAFPLFKNISFEDFGAEVSTLYTDSYAFATGDDEKVSSFGWVANDDSLPPGFSDKFFALAQSLFSNSDLEAQLAQLDADWDIAAGQ